MDFVNKRTGKRRVVVTGGDIICGLGRNADTTMLMLHKCKNAVTYMKDWDYYEKLHTRLACPVIADVYPDSRRTHSMGRVTRLALMASDGALQSAELLDDKFEKKHNDEWKELYESGSMGVAYGSSMGSMDAVYDFGRMHRYHKQRTINSSTYLKGMPHTCAANLELAYHLQGRLLNTSEACTSGSSAIGLSYELIQDGRQKIMIAGGADELTPQMAMVFDCMNVTSLKNDTPGSTPRPFDKNGDGLVLGEGAGTLILEDLESAVNRNAKIFAEVVGFGTNTDGLYPTTPSIVGMNTCMNLAIENAGIEKKDIGYVNLHGTSTYLGDGAESAATKGVLGSEVPVSTTKSYIGHTLGACGAIEAWLSICMMNEGWFHPNLNLENLRYNCSELNYIKGTGLERDVDYVMSNNFAFAGINTSLIFKKWKNI